MGRRTTTSMSSTTMNDLDRVLELQREYADQFARTGSPLSMLGVADAVMEEVLIRAEAEP